MEDVGCIGVVGTSTNEVIVAQGLADCQVTQINDLLNLLQTLRGKVLLCSTLAFLGSFSCGT